MIVGFLTRSLHGVVATIFLVVQQLNLISQSSGIFLESVDHLPHSRFVEVLISTNSEISQCDKEKKENNVEDIHFCNACGRTSTEYFVCPSFTVNKRRLADRSSPAGSVRVCDYGSGMVWYSSSTTTLPLPLPLSYPPCHTIVRQSQTGRLERDVCGSP